MKKTYMLSLFLFAVLSVSMYYLTYNVSKDMYEEDSSQMEIEEEDLVIAADANKEQTVTNTTKYILEHYNSKEYTLNEETLPTPADFVGLTREELIDYLQEYEQAPSLEDKQLGFESFELVSFSKDQIVLRKSYHPYADNYKYYMVAENGYVTVYYIDKSTVYEYTNIVVDELPDELKEEVQNGKYISSLDDLYNFLENYSS
ncbi:hypothetical protein [Konateibacter massiliensis]|uniref:hypothetical protein n=1 Tax=Konateibacter massiliensis TaxID=2002841 RepID=UPI000C161C02|nr:hypothetical protein [Konateibacter massiliensis]